MVCPLCHSQELQRCYQVPNGPLQGRDYWHCQQCYLIHVTLEQQLDQAAERAFYGTHHNDPADAGYRAFLQRAVAPLLNLLPAPSQGLDFGCGPAPTVALMLAEHGHQCHNYDPLFANDPGLLNGPYDFIISTEVWEHVANPAAMLKQLLAALKPGGLLVSMTQLWISHERFERWNYRNDPTHVSFFHRNTMQWIANHYQLHLRYQQGAVVIFQTPDVCT